MPEIAWPHAPTHRLSESGTHMVTAATYLKAHHFRERKRLDVLQRGLLCVARDAGWQLEAWAIFSNHYHFIGHSPENATDAKSLKPMLARLHTKTAAWVNRRDCTPGRSVWHNFRDTRLTFQNSYLARLHYVHANPVRHRLVAVPNLYPWCSAAWFENTAEPALIASIYAFKIDSVNVPDDFEPLEAF